jgi:thioredoxin 1
MAKPQAIRDNDFQREVIESDLPVVVDFWAPWCAPCRVVAPVLEQLSEEFGGLVRFVKVNVDENPIQAARFDVRGIPTLAFVRDGQLVDAVVGTAPAAFLADRIRRTFGLPRQTH